MRNPSCGILVVTVSCWLAACPPPVATDGGPGDLGEIADLVVVEDGGASRDRLVVDGVAPDHEAGDRASGDLSVIDRAPDDSSAGDSSAGDGGPVAQGTWVEALGTAERDHIYHAVVRPGGGMVVVGDSFASSLGGLDVWVAAVDAVGGLLWQRSFGGAELDSASRIVAADDGYLVIAETYSWGFGGRDMWLLRLEADGAIRWQRVLGGSAWDGGSDALALAGGGFLVVGETQSFGEGEADLWALELSAAGEVVWQKTYGDPWGQYGYRVVRGTGGGYVVAGINSGNTTNPTSPDGDFDIWMLELAADGALISDRTYGAGNGIYPNALVANSDGTFFIAGYISHGSIDDNYSNTLAMLVNADSSVGWQRSWGNSAWSELRAAAVGPGGGYLLTGYISGFGAGGDDLLLLALDPSGTITWQRSYGDSSDDDGRALWVDNGLTVAGQTRSFGGGQSDGWLLQLDSSGNTCSAGLAHALDLPSSPVAVDVWYTRDHEVADGAGLIASTDATARAVSAVVTRQCAQP